MSFSLVGEVHDKKSLFLDVGCTFSWNFLNFPRKNTCIFPIFQSSYFILRQFFNFSLLILLWYWVLVQKFWHSSFLSSVLLVLYTFKRQLVAGRLDTWERGERGRPKGRERKLTSPRPLRGMIELQTDFYESELDKNRLQPQEQR